MGLRTNRGLVKFILLSLITLDIYGIWCLATIGDDLNVVVPTEKRTTSFWLCFLILSWLTLGIYPLYWFHKMSNKVSTGLAQKGINYNFNAGTFWLWGVLGSCIVVGPFIYYHKLFTAMNMLNGAYNSGR